MAGVKRARVFFDIAPFGDHPGGWMVFELYTDIVPTTAQNFRQLCTGEHGVGKGGKPLTYKGTLSPELSTSAHSCTFNKRRMSYQHPHGAHAGSTFHRIIPGFMVQGEWPQLAAC